MRKVFEVLEEIRKVGLVEDYAIGGAFATIRWTEPFLTEYIDVFLKLRPEEKTGVIDLSPLYGYLRERGYQWRRQWIIIEGVPVDFIVADELEEEAIDNSSEVEVEGIKIKVFSPEYLIAISVRTGRDKDLWRAKRLMEFADREKLKDILLRWDLLTKFEKLTGEKL